MVQGVTHSTSQPRNIALRVAVLDGRVPTPGRAREDTRDDDSYAVRRTGGADPTLARGAPAGQPDRTRPHQHRPLPPRASRPDRRPLREPVIGPADADR